jgi:hypothetical protein
MRRPATKSNPAQTGASTNMTVWSRFPAWLTAALLALVTIVVYWPVTRCDFVNFDDPTYVTENFHVQAGLKWEGVN